MDSELKQINARFDRQKRSCSDWNLPATPTGTGVKRQTTTAFALKTVTTAYLQASPDPLCITPPTSAYCNTLVNSATVMCFNCGKDGYFTLSCLEPKVIGDIKEIEEEEISNKLGKEEP